MAKILQASKIGCICDLNLWHKARYNNDEDTADKRAAEAGTLYESLAVKWLKQDGFDVEYPIDELYEVEIGDGVLRGRPDCFISKGDKVNVLADIKTMNDSEFKGWKMKGTRVFKPQFVQQLYAYALGAREAGRQVDWLAIVGVNKNSEEYYIDFIRPDDYDLSEMRQRLGRIFRADTPCIPTPSWWCKYCSDRIKNECPAMIDGEPEQVKPGNQIIETEDEEIFKAITQLKEARKNLAQWRDIENDAKNKIDELVLSQGIKTVYSGNLILELNEVYSARFDTTSFKKAHPEMLSEFMKESASLVYKVKEMNRDGE